MEFIKYNYSDKLPARKYEKLYHKWQEAEFAFIGQLLKKMKNKIGLEKWPVEE